MQLHRTVIEVADAVPSPLWLHADTTPSGLSVSEAEPLGFVNCPIAFQPDGQQPLENIGTHAPGGLV
jgi:hypothetical protein